MSFFNKYPYTDFHELNLDWVLSTIKKIIAAIDDFDEWRETHESEYQQLKDLYDDLMSGNFPQPIQDGFYRWMQTYGLDLVGSLAKMVMFRLTDDGHFAADIPDSWSEILFETTGLDVIIPGYDFGHLVLSYEV